jgi:hypothetical protein
VLEEDSRFVVLLILILDENGQDKVAERQYQAVDHHDVGPVFGDFGVEDDLLQER